MSEANIPNYEHHYQPTPINDILNWMNGFLEDWFYWN